MLNLKQKQNIVLNANIELGQDNGKGKGRYFKSRFMEAGIAHYDDLGDILITKETIDKFINSIIGCPVIINHKDVTDKNADKLRVGSISRVWFDDKDGWYYCEGIITDAQAIDLINNQGWSVSSSYSFESDNTPKTYHGKDIDMEFTDGEFLHLAIVENPRYEGANIVLNSKDKVYNWLKSDEIGHWITPESGAKIPIKKGLSTKEGLKHFSKTAREAKNKRDKQKNEAYRVLAEATGKDVSYVKRFYNTEKFQNLLDKAKTSDTLHTQGSFDDLEYFNKSDLDTADTNTQEKWIEQAQDIIEGNTSIFSKDDLFAQHELEMAKYYDKLAKKLSKGYDKIIDKFRGTSDLEKAEKELAKLYHLNSIEDFGEEHAQVLESFYQDLYKEVKNSKEQDMTLAEKIRQVLNDFTINNEKEKDMADDKKDVKNDDKRKLIDEIGGILKGKVDEELWRTIIGKAEKLAYTKSEAGTADNDDDRVDKRDIIRQIMAIAGKHEDNEDVRTIAKLAEKLAYDKSETSKADNKCKNEADEEEKEEKFEEEKEIATNEDKEEKADNKCKNTANNSMKDVKNLVLGGNSTAYKTQSLFVSRQERLELGNKF